MSEPKIGDTVWVFDSNHRVYEKGGHGGAIYAKHWTPRLITGETRTSWILNRDKVDKATGLLRGTELHGLRREVSFLREAVDEDIWVNENRWRIVDAVKTAGPSMLRAIDGILRAGGQKS